jgi:sulfur carrier protein
MKVAINGAIQDFEHAPKLIELLEASVGPGAPPGVAVAINGEVVRRAAWHEIQLSEGDEIEIVKATQGG